MSASADRYKTTPIQAADARAGFSAGVRALDDYFARHALPNDAADIGRAYVLHRRPDDAATLPAVLGFYTLSMASVASETLTDTVSHRLPRYPMPVALIGRLAIDARARGLRLGELLLIDALSRVEEAASLLACLGVIVDAKDEGAAAFYAKYGFIALGEEGWPRRMFLSIKTIRDAFQP